MDGDRLSGLAAAPIAGRTSDLHHLGPSGRPHGPARHAVATETLSRTGASAVYADEGGVAEPDRRVVDDLQPRRAPGSEAGDQGRVEGSGAALRRLLQ